MYKVYSTIFDCIQFCVLNSEFGYTCLGRITRCLINIHYRFGRVLYHCCSTIKMYGTILQKGKKLMSPTDVIN